MADSSDDSHIHLTIMSSSRETLEHLKRAFPNLDDMHEEFVPATGKHIILALETQATYRTYKSWAAQHYPEELHYGITFIVIPAEEADDA